MPWAKAAGLATTRQRDPAEEPPKCAAPEPRHIALQKPPVQRGEGQGRQASLHEGMRGWNRIPACHMKRGVCPRPPHGAIEVRTQSLFERTMMPSSLHTTI